MGASILWRRLDAPGHDACRLVPDGDGWRLEGSAVFRQEGAAARLDYRVACDAGWRTRRGRLLGWIGARDLDLEIARGKDGGWTLGGVPVPGLEGCLDLDLGFTPATNLLAIRRLDLAVGRAAEAPAAWLDLGSLALERLPQRYERRSESTYWYEAPSFGYAALLEVAPSGFVTRYPGFWEAEAIAGA